MTGKPLQKSRPDRLRVHSRGCPQTRTVLQSGNSRRGSPHVLLVLALVILPVLLLGSCLPREAPDHRHFRASQGVMDLTEWNPARDGTVALDGEWEFRPGFEIPGKPGVSFRTVPDQWQGDDAGSSWGQGYGTYSLQLLLPASYPALGLRWLTVATAFEIEADNRLITQVGLPRPDPAIARAAYHPDVAALVPEVTDETQYRKVNLTVRVSNHEYRSGGIWRQIRIGPLEELQEDMLRSFTISAGLSVFIAAIGLQFLIFWIFWRKDRSQLLFALFAFLIALRPLVTGDYLLTRIWPDINFDLLIRIEYLTVFLPVPAGLGVFLSLYPDLVDKRLRRLMFWPFLPFLLALPLTPLPILTRIIFVFYLVSLPAMGMALWTLVRAIRKRLTGSILVTVGGGILGLTVLNDIMYSSFALWTGNLVSWGLAVCMACQSAAMAKNFAATQKRVDVLVTEVHHRVKNSLQVVSSLLSLQAMRTRDVNAKEAFTFMKQRIRAISMVHEKLYSISGAEVVDLGRYLEDLVGFMVSGYQDGLVAPHVTVDAEKLEVDPAFGVDCGLLVSELAANALKHNTDRPGIPALLELSVHRGEGGMVILQVRDNGPGFPPGFDPKKARTQGFTIMDTLVKSRRGSMEILGAKPEGALVRISLRLPD